MKAKTFTFILIALIALCLVCTVAHLIYAIYAYQHCSIIYFIGEELW
ncbi:MAG: hypothetical protein IJ298_01245 [Ruminococcus sp.]|nr:hypothetical protein [Ruminococcus sp.]